MVYFLFFTSWNVGGVWKKKERLKNFRQKGRGLRSQSHRASTLSLHTRRAYYSRVRKRNKEITLRDPSSPQRRVVVSHPSVPRVHFPRAPLSVHLVEIFAAKMLSLIRVRIIKKPSFYSFTPQSCNQSHSYPTNVFYFVYENLIIHTFKLTLEIFKSNCSHFLIFRNL